jgi:two-component system, OmpR family, sensor histidine kinase KdpD
MQRAWWSRGRGARGLTGSRPPLRLGIAVAVGSVILATAAIYPLKTVAPTVSLSVVYLPAVLLASVYWGLWLGLGTSLLSAAAFNFFHLPPVGRFTISDSRNWVALGAFVLTAAVVSTIADVARGRADEAELRRREADLAASLARELLAGTQTTIALRAAAHRVAEALELSSAAIELEIPPGPDERRDAIPLRDGSGRRVATLLVPNDVDADTAERLRTRVVPALGALIAIALQRDAAQAEAVETAALRRSDELKTALLQATSHDLRTPVTAILAAGHALGARSITPEERVELSAAIVEESERLSALIDKLLDLSRLQSGRAEPRRDWISIEEVVLAAADALPERIDLRVAIDPDIPAIRADATQLERAFANLLENAWQYSGGRQVSVHARRAESHVIVRVVDQGPGIERREQPRIFEPFYRGARAVEQRWTGSGLGLAIVKGFVEANGGTISVDSLPGQGASFVISLPIGGEASVAA